MQEKKPLTKRQREVLNKILNFIAHNGYSPSYREVAELLNTSNVSTAQYFIEEFQRKGYLQEKGKGHRSITPLSEPKTVPLLGFIAAGRPIEPIENPEDITVPDNMEFNTKYPHYALKVKGDSMEEMGILSGDIVLIKHQLTAEPGEAVVAITEEGATLKIYKVKNGKPVLEARNKNYPDIEPDRLEIRGKFIGLIRTSEQYF